MQEEDTVLDKIFAELTTLQLESNEAHTVLDILNIPRTKKGTVKNTLAERVSLLQSRLLDKILK